MVAMTTATITHRMRVRQQFGIGAMPIRAITLRYPNARFRGDRLFSNGWAKPRRFPEAIQIDPVGFRYHDVPDEQNAPQAACTLV